jgi:hypothetical protein
MCRTRRISSAPVIAPKRVFVSREINTGELNDQFERRAAVRDPEHAVAGAPEDFGEGPELSVVAVRGDDAPALSRADRGGHVVLGPGSDTPREAGGERQLV